MFRIATAFEADVVPGALQELLSGAPLHMYERNCWNGALDLGEKPAPILQTNATDIFAACLSFTVAHLVLRVAQSGLRDYDQLVTPAWRRQASRLGAEFAYRLTEAFALATRADRRSDQKFDARDDNVERTLGNFTIISQIMYPAISEVRTALANYRHRDPAMRWLRAIDHALYTTPRTVTDDERPKLRALANLLDDTLDAFYPYFLASAFDESVYAQFDD
jgi:hypothetical protein